MSFLRQILSPPRFENDSEKTRQAEFLHYMTLTLMGILCLLILFNAMFDHFAMGVANIVLLTLFLSQLLAYLMIRRGYTREMGGLLLFVGWIGLTWIAGRVEGLRDTAIFGHVVILIGAGFLFGWRAVTFFTVLSMLAVWGLAVLEQRGILNPTLGNPFRIALDLSAGFVLVSLEILFLVLTLHFKNFIEPIDWQSVR